MVEYFHVIDLNYTNKIYSLLSYEIQIIFKENSIIILYDILSNECPLDL